MNKKYLILNLICASVLLFANSITPIKFNKITGSTPMYTADNFNKLLSNTDITFGSENINIATNKSTLVGHNNYIDMNGSGIFGDDSLISNIVPTKRTFDENGNWIPAYWGNYSIGSYNTNIVGDTVFQFGKFLEHYNGNRNFLLGHRVVVSNASVNIALGFQNNVGNNMIAKTHENSTIKATMENVMISTGDSKILDSMCSVSIGKHNSISNSINAITIGSNAKVVNTRNAIQIGPGTNSETNTVKITGCVVVRDNKIPLDSLESSSEITELLKSKAFARTALPQKLSNNASNQEIIDTLNTIIEILNSDLQGTRAPE